VNQDTGSITDSVSKFVDKYNKVIGMINEKSSVDAPDDPNSGEDNESGPLVGSSTAQIIKNRLNDIATDRFDTAVKSGSQIENLSDVGIDLVDPLSRHRRDRELVADAAAVSASPPRVRNKVPVEIHEREDALVALGVAPTGD